MTWFSFFSDVFENESKSMKPTLWHLEIKNANECNSFNKGMKKWCSMFLLTMLGITSLKSCHLFAHNRIVKGLTL
jgi:hypothetical protein